MVNPGAVQGAGPHFHPACGPRAERLDLDGAARRFLGANPFACIAAGIACLWGPAHGGANEAALKMLMEIGTVDKVPEYVKKVKDKNDPIRLMGFGPPRLQELRPARQGDAGPRMPCWTSWGCTGRSVAEGGDRAERIALQDEYLIEKKLYPNIDFYSGITCGRWGFPTSMFTALFALARTVGWIAQWKEMLEDPHQKIGRPRQIYTGPTRRDYTPLAQRR